MSVLTGGELPRLDSLVERHENAQLARLLLAPPSYLARSPVKPVEARAGREIHGSFSLSYGFGKGGYSEKTGSMVLNFEDPEHHLAVAVGYTESHVKGGYGYRGDYYSDSLREYPGGPDPFRP